MNQYNLKNLSIKILRVGKFFGLNLKKNISNKENRILLLAINNKTLYDEIMYINQNLPRLIMRNMDYINFTDIYIITNFPKIKIIKINKKTIFTAMSKIKKPLFISIEECSSFLKYIKTTVLKIRKNNENTKINVIIISKSEDPVNNKNRLNALKNINELTNLCYFDFNVYNKNMYKICNLKYYNILDEKDMAIFTSFINDYRFIEFLESEEVKIKIINGKFLINNLECIDVLVINKFLLIKRDNINNDIIVNISSKDNVLEINISNIMNFENNIYKYIEDFIVNYNLENEYINDLNDIIHKNYILNQKNGNTEIINSYIWLIKYFKNIRKIKINDIMKINNNNNISKLAIKSKNNINKTRFKERFDERIIKNINMIEKSEELFNLDENLINFIKIHDNIDDEQHIFRKSCETFYSMISISDWYEELKNGSSMGLLIKVISNDITKMGLNISHAIIQEITLSCISIKDYIDSIMYNFDSERNSSYGDLNIKEIFKGNGIGTSNAVIPFYINKEHWVQAKKHIPYIFGIILSHNPLGYIENHLNFMFYLLIDMTRRTFTKNDNLSVQWIRMYFALFRTCSEIAFERKYNKGIKRLINNYITNPIKRLHNRPFDNDVILGQILCTGMKLEKDKLYEFIEYVYEDFIRRKASLNYNIGYYKYLQTIRHKNDQSFGEELENLIKYINNDAKLTVEFLVSFLRMFNIIEHLKNELGGFKRLLNIIDENYGVLPDNYCEKILKDIKLLSPDINNELFYKERGLNINTNCKLLSYILQSVVYGKDKFRKDAISKKKIRNIDGNNYTEIFDNFNEIYKN